MHCLSLAALEPVVSDADLVEIRLDLANRSPQQVADWMKSCPLPILLTCGELDPQPWADLSPDWLDIPYDQTAPKLQGTKLIRSYHNYHGMEFDLPAVQRLPAHLYKVAVTPENALDSLALLEMSRPGLLIVGMGVAGMPTRQLSHLTHNPWTYVPHGSPTAEGQLPAELLAPAHSLLGLIGDPIDKSPSHLVHNRRLRELESDAIYCKWQVSKRDLGTFIDRIRDYPIRGFSVTMPLKEAIIPYLDESDSSQVNTIVVENGRWIGRNTDGAGALNAIEKRRTANGATMLILGAGPTALAIATEAKRRGACVTLANRTKREVNFPLVSLSEVASVPYDILVQATSVGMGDPDDAVISETLIRPGSCLLDVIHNPAETRLVRAARAKGCQVVTGLDMFHEQAALQFELWGIMGYAHDEQQPEVTTS